MSIHNTVTQFYMVLYIGEGTHMQSKVVASNKEVLYWTIDLESLFNRWVKFIDAKPKTVETYTRNIRPFFRYLKENNITYPNRENVIAYKEKLKTTLKPSSVYAYLAAVKQFFKWTSQEGVYPNIAQNIKGVKIDSGFKKDYLTSGQMRKLLNSVDLSSFKGIRDYAILSLMVTTGLRTIEVCRANIEDIRPLGNFTALYVQGKGRDEKTDYVKLEPIIEKSIRDYLATREIINSKDPLFASIAHRNNGERMTPRSISRIVKESMTKVGLISDRLTAHSLRHTTATLNLLNGGTPEETKQLLRHANLNTTLIYSHALERANNSSEARIAKAIFG